MSRWRLGVNALLIIPPHFFTCAEISCRESNNHLSHNAMDAIYSMSKLCCRFAANYIYFNMVIIGQLTLTPVFSILG